MNQHIPLSNIINKLQRKELLLKLEYDYEKETFTEDSYHIDTEETSGLIDFRLDQKAGHDTQLLMKSMVLGLQGIQNDYGNEYIILDFKEV